MHPQNPLPVGQVDLFTCSVCGVFTEQYSLTIVLKDDMGSLTL